MNEKEILIKAAYAAVHEMEEVAAMKVLSKLKVAQVRDIRAKFREIGINPQTIRQLADEYGVHWGTMYHLAARKTWKDVA